MEVMAGGKQATPHRARGLHRLSHQRVLKLKEPGKYEDGGGLRLVVDRQLNKRWVLRCKSRSNNPSLKRPICLAAPE